jgi:hypothetical protein
MRRISPLIPAAALYVLLATVLTWPLVLHLGDRVPNDLGDPLLNAWIVAWNARSIPLTERWWNAPQFFPIEGTMAFSEHLLGLWPLTTPVIKMTRNPLLAYNLAFLLSFPLCALAGHALGWSLTRRHDAALVAGLAFGFAPYRAAQLAHVQVLSAYWMPLAFVGLHEYFRDRRLRWLALFGGAWLMQALTCGYYFFYLSVLVGLWLIWFVADRERWPHVARVLGVWVAAALALAPVFYGYWTYQRAYGFRRWPDEIAAFSADVASVLKAPDNLRFWSWLDVFDRPEAAIFPGLTVIVLIAAGLAVAWWHPTANELVRRGLGDGRPKRLRAVRVLTGLAIVFAVVASTPLLFGAWKLEIGSVRILSVGTPHKPLSIAFLLLAVAGALHPSIRSAWARRSALVFYVLGAAVMWLLSLGPVPTLMNEPIIYKAPYTWLMALPGVEGVRVPARFWMLSVLCLAAAAALAVAQLLARFPRARTVLPLAACAGILVDGWQVPLVLHEPPGRRPNRTNAVARLELPINPSHDLRVLYQSIAHQRPIVNGYSGYFAPHYWVLQYLVEQRDPDVLMRLAELGDLEIIVDHALDEGEALRDFVAAAPGVEVVFRDELSTSYRLRQVAVKGLRGRMDGPPLPILALSSALNPHYLARTTDGDLVSRWEAGRGQIAGDALTIDLGQVREVRGIELDIGGYVADFPRGLRIEVSDDGVAWSEAWSGPTGTTALTGALRYPRSVPLVFEIDRRARHIRLTQLGSDPVYYWSVAELRVVGR